MIDINDKVTSCFKINNISKILLSISGGVDSIVLMDILLKYCKYNNQASLSLYHINYNMHNFSDKSFNLCHDYAEKYMIPIYLDSIKISNKNFEANARKIRYDNLNKLLNKNFFDVIITAHNYNDQLETLIMKDENNSDWISFLGVREHYGNIYRPMLNVSKDKIYLYAKENHLNWIEDPTNRNLKFRRNKIRNNINKNMYSKSYIENLFIKHRDSISRMISYNNDFNNTYKKHAQQRKNKSIKINSNLLNDIDDYVLLKLIITNYLKVFFNLKDVCCTKHHWLGLFDFMHNSSQGKIFTIKESILLLKDRNHFILYLNNEIDNDFRLRIEDDLLCWYDTTFKLSNYNKSNCSNPFIKISKQQIDDGLYVTHWKKGDIVKVDHMTKKISDLFINNKISNLNKNYYPILRNQKNEVVWIPNMTKISDVVDGNFYYLYWQN